MASVKKSDGEGSVRRLENGKYECVIQSKYINPKTGKPKRIKRQGDSEDNAREICKLALKAWEKEYERGNDTKVSKRTTFGEYMKEYLETCVKGAITSSGYHSYVQTMKNNFYPYRIANLQLHMLNRVEFQKFYDDIYSKKSKKTCALPRQLCVRCCKWLIDKSLLAENYASQAQFKKEVIDVFDKDKIDAERNRKKIFTTEDIEKFYYAYEQKMGEYPVIVMFLLETGLRVGEFAALTIDNIDFETNKITIEKARGLKYVDDDDTKGVETYIKHPKNSEPRQIYMSDLCRECALYMIEQTKIYCKNNPNNLLYPTFRNGKMRSNSSMEVCFKALCDRLEIDRDVRESIVIDNDGKEKRINRGLCLHSLRHTTDSIANTAKGANVVNTAMMMGHKAIRVENTYTHPTEEGMASIVTPSKAVIEKYKENDDMAKVDLMSDEDKELYQLYQKLKKKFGDL